jgi:putative oxidoreductase
MSAFKSLLFDNVISKAIYKTAAMLESVPYSLLAIPLRIASGYVFWSSYHEHIANWNTTLFLFESEYKVPLLAPESAALLAAVIEFVTPILLLFGLFTRGAALVLLLMTAVIEIFIYPQAWPTHIQWAAMLLVLLCRGAGVLSLDYLLAKAATNAHASAGDPSLR